MEDSRIYLIAQLDENTQQKLANIYGRLAEIGLTGEQTPDIPYHFTLGSFGLDCKTQLLVF